MPTTTSSPTSRVHRDEADPTLAADTWLVDAEIHLRQAGRALEAVGVTDPDAARLAGAIFRFASRVRSDRLGYS